VSGEVAFSAEISDDCVCHQGKARQHCSIVAAGRGTSGRVTVDLVWYEHPRGAVDRMAALSVKHDPVAVVVTEKSQSGTLLKPLADAGVWVTAVSQPDAAVAHGEFLDLVNDGGLEHLGQEPLTAAVRAAQQKPMSGAKTWDRAVSVDQSPVRAATLAVWAFLGWEARSQPGTWVI
jgi:hypothetical protein